MKNFKIVLLLLLISLSPNIFSQENIKLFIKVKDEKNKPVPGAVILIDDVKQNRVANLQGVFKIRLQKAPKTITAFSPVIGVNKIDYQNGQNNITIKISKGENLLYKEKNLKEQSVNPQQFATIYDYLRGNVPGLNVSGTNITIRGFNTVNGNTEPLFIVNGTPVEKSTFSLIIPLEIEKITVLKGAETARYGVRGANGVIVVDTK